MSAEVEFHLTLDRARALAKEGNWTGATPLFEEAGTIAEGEARYLKKLLRSLVEFGRYDQAVPWADRLLALKSDDTTALAIKAESVWQGGNIELAEKLVQQVTQSSPGNLLGTIVLSKLMIGRGDHKEAFAELSPIYRRYPENIDVAQLIADCLYAMGQKEASFRICRSIWNQFPTRLDILSRMVKIDTAWSRWVDLIGEQHIDRIRQLVGKLKSMGEKPADSESKIGALVDGVDFLDFGASKGGSIQFGSTQLGGTKGLGIDNSPGKVAEMKRRGLTCVQADVTQLTWPPKSVRFVTMMHFLEHLPNLDTARKAIRSAIQVATDFIYIVGPFFDADDYLRRLGLKLYWSDWHGHTCHLTTEQLTVILHEQQVTDFTLLVRTPVINSEDDAVHALRSPIDQHEFDPAVHPAKVSVNFDRPIFREMICCIRLRPDADIGAALRARPNAVALRQAEGAIQL